MSRASGHRCAAAAGMPGHHVTSGAPKPLPQFTPPATCGRVCYDQMAEEENDQIWFQVGRLSIQVKVENGLYLTAAPLSNLT